MSTYFNRRAAYTQASISRMMKDEDTVVETKKRKNIERIVESPWFKWLGVAMSAAVVVMFGVVADNDYDSYSSPVITSLNYIFATYFSIEILIRFLVYCHPIDFFTAESDAGGRYMNSVDLVLMLDRNITVFILEFVLHDPDFTVIRTMRAIEMLRISRVWYAIPEVAVTINAMLTATGRAFPIFTLMMITMYAGAVITTVWAKREPGMINAAYNGEPDFYSNLFGSVGYSFMTQLQLAVYDSVDTTLNGVNVFSTPFTVFLVFMILVNAFMVLNTLIGFIYDLVAETTEKGAALEVSQSINKTFNMIDKDLSGEITEAEYETNATPALKRFGINEDVIDRAFGIIDSNKSGTIDKSEFTAYLLKMIRPPSNEELIKLMSELNLVERDLDELERIIQTQVVPPTRRRDSDSGSSRGKSKSRLRHDGIFLTTVRPTSKTPRRS